MESVCRCDRKTARERDGAGDEPAVETTDESKASIASGES
jgi:hypothetical protein